MDQKEQKEQQVVKTSLRTLEEWSTLYKDSYLVGYPKDLKPKQEKPPTDKGEGEQNMDDAEPEDRGPAVDEPTSDEEEEVDDESEKKPKKRLVNWAELPQPVRVIWPNSRVTRDLRPSRLNLMCDADDKIFKVEFF
ncbi:hypothetical protein GGI20_003852 [Coemansia sp. BCRC 34301]|nr:hypothetical protein GGI20_003852 [Coemansia sp. BCRC 34301]